MLPLFMSDLTTHFSEQPYAQFVAVLSEQRSASTAFHQAVAKGAPCVLAVGELFQYRAKAGGLLKWAWSSDLEKSAVVRRRKHPMRFLSAARIAACAKAGCSHKCTLVFKLFDTHKVGRKALREIVNSSLTISVVLRRNRLEARCSKQFSVANKFWASAPSLRTQEMNALYQQFKTECVRKGLFAHEKLEFHPSLQWRKIVDAELPHGHLRRVDVTFKQATDHLNESVKRSIHAAGLTLAQDTAQINCVPEASECELVSREALPGVVDQVVDFNAPIRKHPATTLCIVTMITDYTPTLKLWTYHHIYSVGVEQIRAYFTNKSFVANVPRCTGLLFMHMDVATHGHDLRNNLFLSRRNCPIGSRKYTEKGMCKVPVYMPEQALTLHHAALTSTTTWIAAIDVDEYLVGNGRWPRSMLSMMKRVATRGQFPPGGFKITQIQMLATNVHLNDSTWALPITPNRFQSHKCIIRRDALETHPRSFGSIHEITLKEGEVYHKIDHYVAALLHYRYVNWDKRLKARLEALHCFDSPSQSVGSSRETFCTKKIQEMSQWEADMRSMNTNTVFIDPRRIPHKLGLVYNRFNASDPNG